MSWLHWSFLIATVLVLLLTIAAWITASYAWPTRKPKRYVAEDIGQRFLNVPLGVVKDTTPELPSTLDRTGTGWEYVTTLSRARFIARWANRKEGEL